MIPILLIIIIFILWRIYRAHVPPLRTRMKEAVRGMEEEMERSREIQRMYGIKVSSKTNPDHEEGIWNRNIGDLFKKKKKRRVAKIDEKGKFVKS